MKSLDTLEIYKGARAFRIKISKLVKSFPSSEKYLLVKQIVRSSRSVSANIAEGYGRFHYQENMQFLRIARGSLIETLDHINCAFDEDYISKSEHKEIKDNTTSLLRQINGFIRFLHKSKNNPNPK